MMASNFGGQGRMATLVPDSPAVKRQKTASGYNSTSTSAQNTPAYNSDNDSGDELFANYVPDTPDHSNTGIYETQPTQVIDPSTGTFFPSNRAPTPPSVVQVPASSPFAGRDSAVPQPLFTSIPTQITFAQPPRNLAMSMAPAGTVYRPPHGIVAKPLAPKNKEVINIDNDETGAVVLSSSDDDDALASANIKPTTFSNGSNGNSKFQSILANAAYKGPSRAPRTQSKPDRAQPLEDVSVDDLDADLRQKVVRLRMMFPKVSVLMAQNAILHMAGSVERATLLFASSDEPAKAKIPMITIDDETEDELAGPQPVKPLEPQMKRTLNEPIKSLRDKYSSTQAQPRPAPAIAPRPKKRLVQGRRNPSDPVDSSPVKPRSRSPTPVYESLGDDETDSGVGSAAEEEDPELEGRLLKFLNNCKVEDLVELTSIAKDVAEMMIAARPFRSIDAARTVENTKPLKSGKKSNKAPIGDKIINTAIEMFQGYEAIDKLVAECGQLGKPLGEEMAKWGFDVFGAQKDGELEMTSLEEDSESQRDSGIGSPSSADVSANGDDDIKVSRKRSHVQFLKKPEMMAEDCVLKDYQIVGLNWLALMYRHKLSGILADEMGLGKTCQVIAFISHLVETGYNGPHLVVCPGSTLENWLREFQKFSPHLMVEPYHGAQKDRPEMAENILANRDRVNVVVTTYDMAAKKEDNKFMKRLRPDVCVYDEGHMLKNVASQRYQGLIRIPANFRLLLTGTPLQNNLQELAALLAFILPSVFRDVEDDLRLIFKSKATTADKDHAALLSAQRIGRARSMLTPFVLRRKKAQVLKHLPAKTCRVEYTALHKAQNAIYNGHLDQARERARIRVEGGKIPRSDENNPLMQLRKAAIHPLLFRRHFDNDMIEKMADILRKKDPVNFPSSNKRQHLIDEMRSGSDFWLHQWCRDYPCIAKFDIPDLAWMDSGKVASLIKLVKQYKENGDRVLIFSQFALVLDILEAVLNSSLIAFTRIDGSTKIEERQSLIDTFRDDDSITAFLLTTKAGGTGINLMYANKVIIFDGSFNPQDDRQAENRAHRVGQTREVEVVRLVTKGTVEEQIFALGQSKLALDGRVAGDEDSGKAEEAGEKAVARMMLEGTSITEVDDEETPGPEEKLEPKSEPKLEPEPETKAGERPKRGKRPQKTLPQRKKSSLIDQVAAASTSTRPKRKASKMNKVIDLDEDEEEMLV